MSDVVRPPDVAHRLARLDPCQGLAALMGRQLRLAAHLHAPRLRPGPALTRADEDELALEFS